MTAWTKQAVEKLLASRDFKYHRVPLPFGLATPGQDQIILYAYPVNLLREAKAEFPKGKELYAEGLAGRVVHPFYRVSPEGKMGGGIDPTQVTKRIARLQIVPQ